MQTEIKQASPVEYELDIRATAEDVEPKLKTALRRQRKNTDMKGFRKGKVPLALVKKMHGEAIGYSVAEQMVQEAFEQEVEAEDSELDVLGQPQLTELDYELDGDLHAVIRFGVRPQVELKDLSDESISKLVHEVTDEDVEDELENLRMEEADLIPVDDAPADEEDYVIVDLQRIDPSTDTPIIGDKEEDLTFFLDDDRLREELRDAIMGQSAGATFRVELPRETGPEADDAPEVRLYEVTLKDVKRRELPEVDAEFVRTVTEDEFDDPDAFRQEIRERLERAWERQSRELLQNDIVERMLELHTVPVPQSVVETYLDSFVEQVEDENDGELPEDFDEQLFRKNQEGEAERQGRWMLIRDALIEEAGLEVSDDDLERFFEEQADEQLTAEQLAQFYRSMPRLMERVRQQVLNRKVFDTLAERFDLDEKDIDAYEAEKEAAHAHNHPHGHEHAHAHEAAESEATGESPIITE